MNSSQLLDQLRADVREIILTVGKWKSIDPSLLTKHPQPGSWSAAQCLRHMNVYSDYYLPAIESAMSKTTFAPSPNFSSGWLGAYFTKLMKTDNTGKVKKKMKSPANARPVAFPDAQIELETFLSHQHQLLNILDIARKINLGKTRIPISIAPYIKLKLGDTFMFFVEHEKRHLIQAKRAIS